MDLSHDNGADEIFKVSVQGVKSLWMHHLSLYPVTKTSKTLQSPQSDLTPWTLTLEILLNLGGGCNKEDVKEYLYQKTCINKVSGDSCAA